MHPFFKSLEITNAPGVQVFLMDIHHYTPLRSILEDDSISSTSKTCICSYLGEGARLWLVTKPSICLFHIAHFTFTSMLHLHFSFTQPSASSFFECKCGHRLDTFGTHLIHCPFEGQLITTHEAIWNVMYALVRKSGHAVRKKVVEHLYIRSFITSRSLYDLKGPYLYYQCDVYWPDVKNNGFQCY
jgi:hypothetical protein